MKINWGTGISIFIVLFLVAMISFVFFASKQDFDLVEEDYYPKELNWDSQMDKRFNNASLEEPVQVDFYDSLLLISFPSQFPPDKTEGEILFYRPSAKSLDIKFNLNLDDSSRQFIPTADMPGGKYVVKIDWQYGGNTYYLEKSILKK